ncbi:MAG TPA: DegT/DnrJ/EryC1/StrS family aminotransferase [Syntrophorhabdales bacterium]|nr:DegT/DnrJ/EryC1/StrS family aminotransferase [Syntrophorhabdales bacterium]
MIVKIFDLEREYQILREEMVRIFEQVHMGGEFILGRHVKVFEASFANYLGVRYSLGVGSGTDALRIGGLGCGLKAGDKIITTPNTYIATTMALSMHRVVPVFCDVETETYNMDPERLEEALKRERGVRVCIPVHLYGHAAPMDEIMDLCTRYGVSVVEDACQAHGALYKGKKVGTFGKAAAFSFYPTKNLGCQGDGGAIATSDEEAYRNAHRLRNYGQADKHVHVIEGFNSRLDELQAAILSFKLTKLDTWNEERRKLAILYQRELQGTPLILPQEKPWAYHVYHLFVVRSKERDKLQEYLKTRGISTLIHYPTPIHLQEVYRHLGHKHGDFPHAEQASAEILSLPMYPGLREDEVLYVCEAIKAFYTNLHSKIE